MKILFLNIFEGCQEGDRFQKIIHFLRRESPDVVGLSELYDWDRNDCAQLKSFLEQTKYPFHTFHRSRNRFHVGMFSKYPLSYAADICEGKGMAKAKATVSFGDVSFSVIVAHLSADNEDMRLQELDGIIQHIERNKSTVLMGDLNSLSPLDTYDEKKVLEDMRSIGSEKFGKENLKRDVVQRIMDAGFIDAVREHSMTFEHSVPTAYCKDKNHFTQLRLDYLFITDPLRSRLKTAHILRTEETNQLSDHFPLVAEFII